MTVHLFSLWLFNLRSLWYCFFYLEKLYGPIFQNALGSLIVLCPLIIILMLCFIPLNLWNICVILFGHMISTNMYSWHFVSSFFKIRVHFPWCLVERNPLGITTCPPREDFRFPLPHNRRVPWTWNHSKLNFCLWVYWATYTLGFYHSNPNGY